MYNQQFPFNQYQAIKKVNISEQYYPKPPILYKQSNLQQQSLQPENETNSLKSKFCQVTPTFQPYLPNHEIEKVIKKYKSPEIQEPSSNIIKRPNIIQKDQDILNELNIRNQNNNQLIKDQIVIVNQKEFKNDKLIKLIICCIIILQGLYIISLLNSN